MNPQQYQRLRELFLMAQDLPSAERDAWLARSCGNDRTLRRELGALLRDDAHESAFLETPLMGRPLEAVRMDPTLGQDAHTAALAGAPHLPGYRLLRVLGQGGMGVVYEAEQQEPVQRQVAIKVIRQALDSPEARARFVTERQTLARMNHPSIATVYGAGATADGRPYVVMERVEGTPVVRYCEAQGLGLRARIELFLSICLAV